MPASSEIVRSLQTDEPPSTPGASAAVQSIERKGATVEIALRGGGPFAIATDREVAGATLDGQTVEVTRHDECVAVDTGDHETSRLALELK